MGATLRDDEIYSEVMVCMWDSRVNFLTIDYRTFWYRLLFLCKLPVIKAAPLPQSMAMNIYPQRGHNK